MGLNIVNHLASRNANLPILNNVLIAAQDGLITLATTNLEIGIKIQIRGKVESEGQYTVPARLLAEYVSLLPRENVEMELNDNGLDINCKNSKTQIKGMSAEDYPLIPEVTDNREILVDVEEFRNALNQTIFAANIDESRPEISGVLFNFNGNQLTLAATDSYRLAEKKLKIKGGAEQRVIVPLKTLQELSRIVFDSQEKEIKIILNDNQISFNYNNLKLISRLIDGSYPDYEQIIPTEEKNIIKVKTEDLSKAIKGAALFCKTGINDVKVTVLPEKNEVVIASTNSGLGENITNIEAEVVGEEMEIVFNWRYLLDGLNNLHSNKVILKTTNPGAPGTFIPEESEDYLYIVMPIRQ